MLLIYTHKITPRFSYVMRHICHGILGLEVIFSTKVEDFIKHKGPKITYTKQPLQNEFFIKSHDLLFEQGINDLNIKIEEWNEAPCFFKTDERSGIPYDIFAASFFLLSRYEEYMPHVKDSLGRFPAKDSLAYQNGFLELPVVDIWAYKFHEALLERFGGISKPKRRYVFSSIINVTTSHSFSNRGIARSLGGFFVDLGSFKVKRLFQRISVLLRLKKDPYDNFMNLVEIHKRLPIKTMFFFQFAKYSTHDKNISPNNNKFRYLIKSVADYSTVSLSTSFNANTDKGLLVEEKKRLEELINRPVTNARLRYNKVNIPTTYRHLIEAEFTNDYTMGYTHEIGFRAGTCSPFYFYDINLEVQQPLKVHPFAFHDYALTPFTKSQDVFEKLDAIYRQVQNVDGQFTTIFSNELLGENHEIDWLNMYQALLKRYYV